MNTQAACYCAVMLCRLLFSIYDRGRVWGRHGGDMTTIAKSPLMPNTAERSLKSKCDRKVNTAERHIESERKQKSYYGRTIVEKQSWRLCYYSKAANTVEASRVV